MATDEQILAKTTELLANLQEKCWKGYEKKGMKTMFGKRYPNCVKKKAKKRKNEEIDIYEEKVLREVTEDEMNAIEDVLYDLEPSKLPLNSLFSDKMRIIIPFPTMDNQSELGQFVEELQNNLELNIDWNTGMVSAERQWTLNSVENDDNFAASLLDRGPEQKVANKKIQMKLGKYFVKLDKAIKDYHEMRTMIVKKIHGHKEHGNMYNAMTRLTVGEIQDTLGEDIKHWHRILNTLELLMGTSSMGRISKYFPSYEERTEKNMGSRIPILAKYWQENAGYIKQNIDDLTNDKYSIIITRHPVDVLRMSDFDKITSCHSPSSRTNAYQSYYKCAVAEAQGHGAVAYVVETEDIVKWSGRSDMSMEEIEEEMQDGEIFYDDKRQYAGTIEPISRTRIRHMRYYDTDSPARYDDGIDIGVPENRIYGAGIPGFKDTIVDWSRQSQEEVIENIPREDGKINLNRFMIFGGSYEDTSGTSGRQELVLQLVGPNQDTVGSVKQNTDTEDTLDADLIGDIVQQYENYCSGRTDYWNNHMAACEVEYGVNDDGDGGVYIAVGAKIQIEWDASDWNSLPNAVNRAVMYSPDTINDIYGDLLKSDGVYLQRRRNRRGEDLIVWHCDIEPEHPDLGGSTYLALDEEYEEFCAAVDLVIDEKRDAFKEILTNYFAREGFMQGGEYINFAVDVENGEISSYEWDVETDGDYEDSYETYASYSFDYELENFKSFNEDVLKDILNSRDYKIQLRRNLLQQPQQVVNTDYFLSMKAFANKYVEGELRVTVTFSVNRDEPDEMVTLFKELIDGDMDDEDNLTVVFNKTLAQIATTMNSGQWPEQESPATARLNENLVKTWKQFLYS